MYDALPHTYLPTDTTHHLAANTGERGETIMETARCTPKSRPAFMIGVMRDKYAPSRSSFPKAAPPFPRTLLVSAHHVGRGV